MAIASALLTLAPAARVDVHARVDAFLAGGAALTGVDLYLLLERVTPLIMFHTMLRTGRQNRMRSGLQQSYGDHNRLLLLGLDKLEDADLAWYRGRLEREDEVADHELLETFAAVRSLGLTPPLRVALWLAAALHDCGRLDAHTAFIDVENAVVLGRELLDDLCPGGLRDLALFVVHNHDYVKDIFFGEVPVSFVAGEVDRLPAPLRSTAVAALGMVQVAGAASLGEGRLTALRVQIFRRCADASVLADRSAGTRLARLLAPPAVEVPAEESRRLERAIDGGARAPLRRLLECVPLHGWHRRWAPAEDPTGRALAEDPTGRALAAIESIAERFWRDFSDRDHVVLGRGVDLGSAGAPGWRLPACGAIAFRNGTRAMVVGGS